MIGLKFLLHSAQYNMRCREIAEILARMRKAEKQERQRWEAVRLALAEAPDQAAGEGKNAKAKGRKALESANEGMEVQAASAKSGARKHGVRAAAAQLLLSPITPPQQEDESVGSCHRSKPWMFSLDILGLIFLDAAERHGHMLMCVYASRHIVVKDRRRVSAPAEVRGAAGNLIGKDMTQRCTIRPQRAQEWHRPKGRMQLGRSQSRSSQLQGISLQRFPQVTYMHSVSSCLCPTCRVLTKRA